MFSTDMCFHMSGRANMWPVARRVIAAGSTSEAGLLTRIVWPYRITALCRRSSVVERHSCKLHVGGSIPSRWHHLRRGYSYPGIAFPAGSSHLNASDANATEPGTKNLPLVRQRWDAERNLTGPWAVTSRRVTGALIPHRTAGERDE